MKGCVYRTESDLCKKFTTDHSISFCVGRNCPDRKESNADRIRAMTDEELAKFISGKARTFGEEYEGYVSAFEWLQAESGEA